MNIFSDIIVSKVSSDLIIPFLIVPFSDIVLCAMFGTKSRWFQLHSLINGIIVYIIWNDVWNFFNNPISNISTVNSKMDSYFIMMLHIYHAFIAKHMSFMDYFHHILFVGMGVIPAIILFNSNIVRLAWFPACGLPGCIEYFLLSLVKHNLLNPLTQKRLSVYIYNYIRYPLTIYCPSLTYIAYKNNLLKEINVYLVIYVNLILFFNGVFYNNITIENYISHKYGRNNHYPNLQNSQD